MLNIFEFSHVKKHRMLIELCKQVSKNHPIMFLDRGNKMPASFSYLLELKQKKIPFKQSDS